METARPQPLRVSRRMLLAFGASALLPAAAFGAPKDDVPSDSFLWDIELAVDKKALGSRKRSADDLKRLEEVLKLRLPILTLAKDESKITIKSDSEILIRVPSDQVVDPQVAMLSRVGDLELRYLDDLQTSFNPEGRYFLETLTVQGIETKSVTRFRDRKTNLPLSAEKFLSQSPLLATSVDLEPDSAHRVGSGLQMAVRARFNKKVAKKLESLAGKPGRLLAMALDGQIVSIYALSPKPKQKGKKQPKEESDFGDVDVLAGFGTEEEAQWLAVVLNSGPLPLPLKVVSSHIYVPENVKSAPGA